MTYIYIQAPKGTKKQSDPKLNNTVRCSIAAIGRGGEKAIDDKTSQTSPSHITKPSGEYDPSFISQVSVASLLLF